MTQLKSGGLRGRKFLKGTGAECLSETLYNLTSLPTHATRHYHPPYRMPRSQERSLSPARGERRRSRSPRRRDDEAPRKKSSGFRWKEKRRDDDRREGDRDRGLERGYRERERGRDRDRDRPRSPFRDRDRERDRGRYHERSSRGTEDRGDYRGREREREPGRREDEQGERKPKEKKEKKEKKQAVSSQPAEPMIIVNVNDRLGTKAAIPCLASDPISELPRYRTRRGCVILLTFDSNVILLQNYSKPKLPRASAENPMRYY